MGIVSKNWSAEVTAELLQHRWCAVFGPPELLQTDAGREYEDVIQKISKVLDFRHEIVPPGAKWRQGQVERHGAVVKLMMMRVIATQQAKERTGRSSHGGVGMFLCQEPVVQPDGSESFASNHWQEHCRSYIHHGPTMQWAHQTGHE